MQLLTHENPRVAFCCQGDFLFFFFSVLLEEEVTGDAAVENSV